MLAVALAVLTVIVYAPVRGFEFVNYDDPEYVTANPMVARGLTGTGIAVGAHDHPAAQLASADLDLAHAGRAGSTAWTPGAIIS